MRRVAVVGSRGFTDYDRLARDLDRARARWGDFTLVSGGARGADSLAERWAQERGLPTLIRRVTPGEWRELGKRAGPLRNTRLVAAADAVIAFWDGKSPGTADCIRQAEAAGKPVFVRRIDAEPEER
jgi:hypothetical protein